MSAGLKFKIGGIPVRVDPTFLLIAVLLGYGARSGRLLVSWVAIVFGSVLLHEVGHAVAFRHYGKQPQILLQGMGGLTSAGGEALPPRRDVVVSLAGPLTGLFLLGLPALWLSRSTGLTPTWHTVVSDVVFVNIAWSVLNLLPVLPLDGGRVTAALLALRSHGGGERQAHMISAVVAVAGGLYALTIGYTFGALFAGFFCAYNVSQLVARRTARHQQTLVEGWQALAEGDAPAAATAAERILADRPTGIAIARASELLAWSRLAAGDAAAARAAIERFPPGPPPDPTLLATLALDAGQPDAALDLLAGAYGDGRLGPAAAVAVDAAARAGLDQALADRLLAPGGPGPAAAAQLAVHLHRAGHFTAAAEVGRRAIDSGAAEPGRVAYNLACSHARAGHTDAALDWLARAVDLGFVDVALLDTDPDLEPLRGDDRFQALSERLRRGM